MGYKELLADSKNKKLLLEEEATNKKIKEDQDSADGWGAAFDAAVAIGAGVAAIPTGGMSLAAIPAVLGTAGAAKAASTGIREGVMEGDANKLVSGVASGAAAAGGITDAKTLAATNLLTKFEQGGGMEGGMDVLTTEEIDRLLELEETQTRKEKKAKKKIWS